MRAPMEMRIENLHYWQTHFCDWLRINWIHDDGAHDINHLNRVWRNCRKINDGESEKGDLLVLLTAAYFHDLIALQKDHPERDRASWWSARKTVEILQTEFNHFPKEKLEQIHHAIHAHSFSAGIETNTIEAKILQDADRMDALGATGIARLFYTAAKMNASLYHAEDALGNNRELDDKKFALDHIELKLLKLPGTMKTATGKEMAEIEADYIRSFRLKLLKEIEVD